MSAGSGMALGVYGMRSLGFKQHVSRTLTNTLLYTAWSWLGGRNRLKSKKKIEERFPVRGLAGPPAILSELAPGAGLECYAAVPVLGVAVGALRGLPRTGRPWSPHDGAAAWIFGH